MAHVYDRLHIGGTWVEPSTGAVFTPLNASTEEPLGQAPAAGEADVDRAVTAARRAVDDPAGFGSWEPVERAERMERLADALESRAAAIAERVSSQNGMPLTLSRDSEGGMPATILRYYADLARRSEPAEVREGLFGGRIEVRRQPIGVVAAIVPWNYPQTLAAMKIAPALAAGCAVVLKPSPETALDSFLLAEAVEEAGLPGGTVNIVPAGREVGQHLVAHPGVDKVAFTGSTAVGRAVAETCGRLLRPVTLELGGKSAALVLDDADLDEAAPDLVPACLANNGQTCFLGTRLLAPRSRYAEVVDAVTDLVRSLRVGDALDPDTEIGPLATAAQRERVESYIARGRDEGRLTTGGGRPRDRGWFVEPTVFADVDNGATIAREEIFGPVLAVVPYDDVDDAVRIANDSEYGLGGTVWTADPQRGAEVARRVRTGTIGVNHYAPDPVAPFGGVGSSGIGRELGPEALAHYQQPQTVYL